MIKIEFDSVNLSLTAEGHAGYAPAGEDIVCAGVSALIYALPSAFNRTHIAHYMDTEAQRGYIHIKARPTINQRFMCLVIYQAIMGGLENIAQQYPEHIQLTDTAEEADY